MCLVASTFSDTVFWYTAVLQVNQKGFWMSANYLPASSVYITCTTYYQIEIRTSKVSTWTEMNNWENAVTPHPVVIASHSNIHLDLGLGCLP